MLKKNRVRITAIIVISFIALSFSSGLEYRDVYNGKLKILIPANFIHVPKEAYKSHYEGDRAPDDFYCNNDTTEAVGFMKTPSRMADLGQAKQLAQMALLDTSNKVHFNDTISVNGNKVYLLDMDGMAAGKLKYLKTFIINTRDESVVCIIYCDMALKKTWLPISDQMFKSIRVN